MISTHFTSVFHGFTLDASYCFSMQVNGSCVVPCDACTARLERTQCEEALET